MSLDRSATWTGDVADRGCLRLPRLSAISLRHTSLAWGPRWAEVPRLKRWRVPPARVARWGRSPHFRNRACVATKMAVPWWLGASETAEASSVMPPVALDLMTGEDARNSRAKAR